MLEALDLLVMLHGSHGLHLDLPSDQLLLLQLHLRLNILHHNVVFKSLVVVVSLLFSMYLFGLLLLHALLVVTVDHVVDLGLVHDLVQTLRQHELLQMLLVNALLFELRVADLV